MENKLVPMAGYPIWGLDCAGFKRKLTLSNIGVFFKNLTAQRQAKKLLSDFRPDAVIGTGGYVCYPIIKEASKMGIYTALHESNASPGLAVRMLSRRVNRIFTGFESAADVLGVKEKCTFTGNPVKVQNDEMTKAQARSKLGVDGKYRYIILSFGGSLGAEAINNIALEIMEKVSCLRGDVLHIHSCGKIGASAFYERFNEKGFDKLKNIRASEYIYDMPLCLKAADIVISRSGAMTVAEIAQAGAPAILVPSPNVTGNHQYMNANELAAEGAAFMVQEREDVLQRSLLYVKQLLTDRELRREMSRKLNDFARPMAADAIAEQILQDIQTG